MYDRDKAVKYAMEHYNGWSSQYPDYDSKYKKQGDSTDCANFVSQCLHEGGIPFSYGNGYSSWWCDYRKGASPYGKGKVWSGSHSLKLAIFKKAIPYLNGKDLKSPNGLLRGDLIFELKGNTYGHVMIVARDYDGNNEIEVYQRGVIKNTNERHTRKRPKNTYLYVHIESNNSSTPNIPPSSGYSDRYGNTTLKIGSNGNFVRNMQNDLSQLGYSIGKVDGVFGANTEKAVKQFQKEHGLKDDGLFGRMSKEKLYSLIFNTNNKEIKNNENKEITEADKMNKKDNKELQAYNTAIIMLENGMLNIRKKPDGRSAVVAKLYPFQIVSAMDVNDKWCAVYILNGEMIGYAMKKFVKIVSNAEDFLSTAKEW